MNSSGHENKSQFFSPVPKASFATILSFLFSDEVHMIIQKETNDVDVTDPYKKLLFYIYYCTNLPVNAKEAANRSCGSL